MGLDKTRNVNFLPLICAAGSRLQHQAPLDWVCPTLWRSLHCSSATAWSPLGSGQPANISWPQSRDDFVNGGNSNGKSMKTTLKTNRPRCEVLLLSADFSPGYNFSSRLQAAAMLRLSAEGGMMIQTGKRTMFVRWRITWYRVFKNVSISCRN